MKCSNCGSELPNDAHFCDNCGSVVQQAIESQSGQGSHVRRQKKSNVKYIVCGNCGAKNPDNLQACSVCGFNLHTRSSGTKHTAAPKRASADNQKYTVAAAVLIGVILLIAAIIVGYYVYTGSDDADEIQEVTQAPATDIPTAAPTAAATPDIGGDIADTSSVQYETYYIVNCDYSISTLQSPSVSAVTVCDIPLGSPVSYVESYQNGFAKVIYNGTEGYVLQSYLSNNSADIKKPIAAGTDSSNSSNTTVIVGAVSNPVYKTYTDSTYSFSCSYPSHFTAYNDSDSFVRYSLQAPDNTATLKICAKTNSSNTTAAAAKSSFQSAYPGSIDYQNSGDDWFACRTYKNGTYHYAYYKFKDGMIRGFELHFDGNYFDIYDDYVNDIYKSLKYY